MAKEEENKKPHVNIKLPKPNKRIKGVAGSDFEEVNNFRLKQVLLSLWLAHCSNEDEKIEMFTVAGLMMSGINPKDEIEGMLAAQLVSCHNAAMECYRRAMIGEQTFEGRNQNLAFANKLSRTYALQMEALQKYRGKGQQKMTVEHIHVHSGGQAIVGTVEQKARGGGAQTKSEEQPHAKQIEQQPATPAPFVAMPCENKEREVMPVPGDA